METAYVGRFGHHLLQQLDLAQPLNLVDPQSGLSYFQAATLMSKLVDINGGDTDASVPAIPYFENLFPWWAMDGVSATQNIYSRAWIRGGETTSLSFLDEWQCASTYAGCGPYTNTRFYQQHSLRCTPGLPSETAITTRCSSPCVMP